MAVTPSEQVSLPLTSGVRNLLTLFVKDLAEAVRILKSGCTTEQSECACNAEGILEPLQDLILKVLAADSAELERQFRESDSVSNVSTQPLTTKGHCDGET